MSRIFETLGADEHSLPALVDCCAAYRVDRSADYWANERQYLAFHVSAVAVRIF